MRLNFDTEVTWQWGKVTGSFAACIPIFKSHKYWDTLYMICFWKIKVSCIVDIRVQRFHSYLNANTITEAIHVSLAFEVPPTCYYTDFIVFVWSGII